MPQINKPTDYFNTVLWTGDGSASRDITGVGFQPDFTWIKERSGNLSHVLGNSVSGDNKFLTTNGTGAEDTDSTKFRTFVSDGFQVGSHGGVNGNTDTYVGWSWLGGGTASSNTDGSITSNVSASTTSGFSIVSYTGTGATATVGHGLSQTPEMVIVKLRSGSGTDWITWGSVLGGTVGSEFIKLNNTGAKTTGLNSSWFNNTAPTSSVFTVGTQSDLNGSSSTYIAYCFHSVKGFSKFGSYTGNGNADGTFVYTGMRPAFVLIKRTNSAGNNWQLYDNKRNAFNVINNVLFPNLSDAEATQSTTNIDMLSQGFKLRGNSASVNGSGDTYIYMAFAENPLVGTNNIPATAR